MVYVVLPSLAMACPRTPEQFSSDPDVICAGINYWRYDAMYSTRPGLSDRYLERGREFDLKVADKCKGQFTTEAQRTNWVLSMERASSVKVASHKLNIKSGEYSAQFLIDYEAKNCRL
jgi:hypothetical protein